MLVSWFSQKSVKTSFAAKASGYLLLFMPKFFAPHQKPTWKRDQAQITSDSKREWHIIRRRMNSKDSSKKERVLKSVPTQCEKAGR